MDTQNQTASSSLKASPAPLIGRLLRDYGIIIAFFVLCGLLTVISPYFLTSQNLLNMLRQSSINGILAIGLTFVILTRGIDLSVGSVVALAGIVGASFATMSPVAGVPGTPYPALVSIIVGLIIGLICGTVSGMIVTRFRVPSFVVTLGMLSSARGLTMLYTGGKPVPSLTPEFRWMGTGHVFGVPAPIIVLLVVFAVSWWVLNKTRYGRHVYAVGGNPRAANTSGIRVSRIRLSVFMISGVTAALAGLLLAARTGSGLTQAGVSYELDAIAAVVIGGTSLSGGTGSVTGTLFGTLIIAVMNNGLDLLGVDSNYQQIIKGLIIVLAVMIDSSRQKEAE
ncbi:ABC transporter permease [Neorhizobium sp. P12A]|uniref:ABC transporter permease n=1 Tax=Rhizobium/Agrobacterium group TaxID=227290 RepID=UPI0010438834|nr:MULTISPECIES: ABC transporter permease [Rhizobium/Agrobacterium group]KAA0691942.1 ABC transporter permease [Neorhizobium sp. P12A]TCR74792.1 monosaccharide ABC transporter membrane protein (CUT2 family) [Rhizobium sp. BK376]